MHWIGAVEFKTASTTVAIAKVSFCIFLSSQPDAVL
jgi:hypothetical protein